MTRHKQLELVKRVTEERAKGALRVALTSRQALEQSQQQMEQLKAYRREYSEKFLRSGSDGISAARMAEFRQFLERLDQAIAAQEQVIRDHADEWHERRSHWREIQSHEQAIGNVVERRHAQELHAEQKIEQKVSDESAQKKGSKGTAQ